MGYKDDPRYMPFIYRKLIEEPLNIVLKEREERKMPAKQSKQYNDGFKAGVEMMRDLLCGRYPHTNSVLKAIQDTAEVLIKRVEGEKNDA